MPGPVTFCVILGVLISVKSTALILGPRANQARGTGAAELLGTVPEVPEGALEKMVPDGTLDAEV